MRRRKCLSFSSFQCHILLTRNKNLLSYFVFSVFIITITSSLWLFYIFLLLFYFCVCLLFMTYSLCSFSLSLPPLLPLLSKCVCHRSISCCWQDLLHLTFNHLIRWKKNAQKFPFCLFAHVNGMWMMLMYKCAICGFCGMF